MLSPVCNEADTEKKSFRDHEKLAIFTQSICDRGRMFLNEAVLLGPGDKLIFVIMIPV